MKAVKLRVANATVAGEKGLLITLLGVNDNKLDITVASLKDDSTVELLVTFNGKVISEYEPNYEDELNLFKD